MTFDPFSMLCSGLSNAESLQLMEELTKNRTAQLDKIKKYLHNYKRTSLKEACWVYDLNINSLTKDEIKYLES